jgi:SAM-dependent methyltransferase
MTIPKPGLDQPDPNSRSCAVCGSVNKTALYHQQFINPTQHGFHSGYDVVVCQDCGFAFADHLPLQGVIDEYYRDMAKKTALLEKQINKGSLEPDFVVRMHEYSLGNIVPHLRENDSILDVGCYTGHLLHLLKQKGFKNVKGLDPSEFASKVAREKYGIEVIVGSLFDRRDIGRFDFITLTHVIEHIVDLRSFVLRLRDLLTEGGRIYIECPDAHNFFLASKSDESVQSEHKVPFFQFSVEHVNFFGTASLGNLMSSLGFNEVMVDRQVSTLAVLASVWQRCPLKNDPDVIPSLQKYIADSEKAFSDINTKLDQLARSRQPIIVWGAGLHTQRLLAASNLRSANIVLFVDSDPGYHGATLAGIEIKAPAEVKSMPGLPIVISSETYQTEIANQIRDMGVTNELVLLY